MSAHEQSVSGIARRPRQSAGLSQTVATAVGDVKVQLAALMALAGVLDLWALSRNGWANEYYSAAVRSMSTSWHNFLFASMDPSGVMTVDKPPLALWIQALSVRVFGYHPLSILVPQALMGMATVALVYDLVRRPFGRLAGFVAGLALALTPITVAISRHNNPDALLVLCVVAALWCTVRALECGRAGRGGVGWLVAAGVCVGLGFETKMGVALMAVPAIAAAWLWVAPHGRGRALIELLGAGAAMVLVGGAWPALVELTPASARPWISGTSNNTIWQLITEYNGAGRLEGQTGGPAGAAGAGGGGNMFGGTPGPLRLINQALGGQAGWLLGLALVSGVAVLVATRLRRNDPRSGWLIAVGGTLAVVAVVFSEAKGIFHPYYVSLLAPLAAALVGAGVAQLRGGGRLARVLAPVAIIAGVACELAVLHDYPGQLTWLVPVLIVVGAGAAIALVAFTDRALRTTALLGGITALLIAPAIWAVDTLGYATSGTFPEGGPQSALSAGGFGGPGGGGFGQALRGGGLGRPVGGPPAGTGAREGPPGGGVPLFGGAGPQGGFASPGGGGRFAGPGGGPGGGAIGAPLGNANTIAAAIAYAKAHGGGTVAVESQSSAASEIVSNDADVAGIGGFSGRESDVSVAWLAGAVQRGQIRWVLSEGSTQGARLPGDTRQGSRRAIEAAAKACRRVTLSTGESASGQGQGEETALYNCAGRAQALLKTQAG